MGAWCSLSYYLWPEIGAVGARGGEGGGGDSPGGIAGEDISKIWISTGPVPIEGLHIE
jgi:hypothetical protein